ncbi:MAG: TonB family protein [Bryobacteraceae bacterium]
MTPQHVDILAEHERLGGPFVASITLHAALVTTAFVGTWIASRQPERWGEPTAMGGAVGVSPVARIPLPPREGPINPVANDTVSKTPQAPPKEKLSKRERERENAIALEGRKQEKKKSEAASRRTKPDVEDKPSQLYSEAGRALVSPMMGQPGSGGVGVGTGTPLGDRFGAYAALLQRLIGEKWVTTGVDARIRTAPPVVVEFTILRDGTLRDVRLRTSSGIRPLDLSALRAVYDVGRVPELPRAYERSEARIEFWFELKR